MSFHTTERMQKKWIFPTEQETVLLDGITPPVAGILQMRGITDPEEFLSEKPRTAHDPFRMKDMEEATGRILDAVEQGKGICIYGDYDSDGICSVAILTEVLKKMGARVSHYIPSRFTEGYGVNKAAIAKIAAAGTKLIVTCDCGITSAEEVRFAKMLGLDFIVTDHHTPGADIPDTLVINPKQADCGYPEKGLCGAGVAFKLVQALEIRSNERGARGKLVPLGRKDMLHVMDLAAIATVGDIVPLRGENRTIVKYGIRELNRNRRPFLKALAEVARLPETITADTVAYGIVPRLNATGRVGTAEEGLALVRSETEEEAMRRAETVDAENTKRKNLQEEAYENTLALVDPENVPPVLFLLDERAHEGIIGIAAGKLKEHFAHPAILFTASENGMYKGSGRSPEGIDLFELLSKGKHLYAHFGGHKSACGLSVPKENFEEAKALIQAEGQILFEEHPEAFLPELKIDWVLEPEEITRELTDDLDHMSPFGAENPEPVFAIRGVIPEDVAVIGQEGQHLRFCVAGLNCIFFRVGPEQKKLIFSGRRLDLAGYPMKNIWRERVSVQFRIQEIREAE